jgi:nucleoside-diphosphate-sugar epimerase
MSEQVLVTGAAGFVGRYVVAELLGRGYRVVGLDNFSKYGEVRSGFDDHPRYRGVRGDAKDAGLLAELLGGCDHLIAGAAMIGGIGYFHALAYDLLAENDRIMAGTCDAAIAAFRTGSLRKVTYISSSMVFENATRFPSREGDERRIPPPSSSYGFQKLAVEYYARAARDQYGLPYTIVRPFNCVGIGEQPSVWQGGTLPGNALLARSHVVPDIVERVLAGESPLRILGDGTQVRHYTYGGDLARGIVCAMESGKACGEDINISTATATTVRDLAAAIWRRIHGDRPLKLECLPAYEYDVQVRIPDVRKARELLGFEATTSLDQVLDEVIPWVRQHLVPAGGGAPR